MNSEMGLPNIEDIIDKVANPIVLGFPYGFEKANGIISDEVNKDKTVGGIAMIYGLNPPRYETKNEQIIGGLIRKYFAYKASLEGGLLDKLDPEAISSLEKERKTSEKIIGEIESRINYIEKYNFVKEASSAIQKSQLPAYFSPEKRIEQKVKKYDDWKSAVDSLDEAEVLTLVTHIYKEISKVYNEINLDAVNF